ncbi:carotenoid 1,2-hydratase [Acidiphilium acidophilum]|uniref:Carotenoid 1,2-hydratase n=1 Tax=Acidiphilium acidophilum TaxID=76588 RepID=A0AAW9DTZ8_ACIAO|nr:carotenoid 1,2-hydratase [Acidiphilium acidophilum]MDX5932117.1 carotenoid 1,2-hydratase [Acidiphilium acidophilum]
MIRFDTPIPRSGYAWWYIDALSDDGQHALTLIAFVGSVFSPYYARANHRTPGGADPEDYVAINLALYGPRRSLWAMTERRRRTLIRDPHTLSIGPSRLDWNGNHLSARIEEITTPIPRPLRGTITLTPKALEPAIYNLDATGTHRWQPVAPCARIAVTFQKPALIWQGDAYFDRNDGDAPMATAFSTWNWSRATTRRGARIFYHANRRDGGTTDLSLDFAANGGVTTKPAPPAAPLPMTWWRLPRETRNDPDTEPRLIRNFEDAPFYARARIATQIDGEPLDTMHETLDLNRFRSPIVQAMLPFRMPRRVV